MTKPTSKTAGMRIYPRGAEWRKWDLHVHAPGTKLNDGYGKPSPWDAFCRLVEDSDVAVIGITDYFSLDSFFETMAAHAQRHPTSEKVFFPNLELRLNESVNTANDIVHIHLVFRPDLTKEVADRFLASLIIQQRDGSGRNLTCAELKTPEGFASATVSREDLKKAIKATFGDEPFASDQVLTLVPANNDGIRAGDSQLRKRRLADEIERQCDALFGNAANRDYFLETKRYEDKSIPAPPKPVFSSCDAHSMSDLQQFLGKTVPSDDQRKEVTWVKADPTFEGLQQTLAEPDERVRIQATRPDQKEPYKVIAAVHFEGSTDFPDKIVLNQNLVSIIGSRSSGKSALLAYIAHAVDPLETMKQQLAVERHRKPEQLGPAAAITWDAVKDIKCTVEWGASGEHSGHVIYIPQNSLHEISQRPEEITAKIEPTVFRLDEAFATAHRNASVAIDGANEAIRDSTKAWFRFSTSLSVAREALREIGDKQAVEETSQNLSTKIQTLRKESSLTEAEVIEYQKISDRLAAIAARLKTIDTETSSIAPYVTEDNDSYLLSNAVRVDITVVPDINNLSAEPQTTLRSRIAQASGALRKGLEEDLGSYRKQLANEQTSLRDEEAKLKADNAQLIEKNAANAEIEELVKSKQKQDEAIAEITRREKAIAQLAEERDAQAMHIQAEIAKRQEALADLLKVFGQRNHHLELMSFGLEQDHASDVLRALAERFNQRDVGPYIDRNTKLLKLAEAHAKPSEFLEAMFSKDQKTMQGETPELLAADVLDMTKESRFFAEMEEDRIGGFHESSMTPGKQSLFALTLILNESDDAWPLLIDQPEDDLDSRSVYDVLVRYLIARKKERQIIMVSHNANLVIGADSEQIVVANRHGADRKNADARQFDYKTGSLEHSEQKTKDEIVLMSCGIREHACELLDGGEEAFRKRRAKYKL
jgi:hypothetical protein